MVYIATSEAIDDEMHAKIRAHRMRRGERWRTLEEARDLGRALKSCSADEAVLVECIPTWLTNLLVDPDGGIEVHVDQFLAAIKARKGDTYLVSNEAGSGVMPTGALSRRFVTLLGQTNQKLARCAESVILVVAGLPVALKGPLPR